MATGITIAVIALLGILGVWLKKKIGTDNAAVEAIWIAVHNTQNDFVAWAKAADEDGKLDADEIKKAEQLAIAKAMEIAKGPALDALKAWGEPKIKAIIADLVQKMKPKPVVVAAPEVKS